MINYTPVLRRRLLVLNAMNGTAVRCISRAAICRDLALDEAPRIVEATVVEQLGQSKAVRLVYIKENVVTIQNLVDPHLELLVSMIYEVKGLYYKCIYDVIRYG